MATNLRNNPVVGAVADLLPGSEGLASGGLPDQSGNTLLEPPQDPNQVRREQEQWARDILDDHRKGRERKFQRDLVAEKYALHVFGGEDSQWFDIVNGSRLEIPPNIDGGVRRQTNLLRPIVENFVAYHTALPYRLQAEGRGDRVSRDKALIDTIFANHIAENQNLNEVMAEALYIAAVYGWCPVHASWRDDIGDDLYEPVYQSKDNQPEGYTPGFIDLWVGDPWTMVLDTNAKRRAVHWASYERVFPLEVVKRAFGDVEGIDTLKGSDDLPSASRLQRILRQWESSGSRPHGSVGISGSDRGDDAVALICRETAPGLDPEWPTGRLSIIAIDGVSDTDHQMKGGRPVLLHDGPLPGGRFSFVGVYAMNRLDDPLGKAFVEDLDELQVTRNNLETLLVEGSRRAAKPPFVVGPSGTVEDDSMAWEDDAIFEVHTPDFTPGFIQYPTDWMAAVANDLARVEQDMFRIGAWQAASRGESNANDPAAKVVALQRADDTVLGPANRAVQGAIIELMQLCHALAKEFAGPIPMPVRVSGDEFGYMAASYIYASDMSDEPPQFVVTSGMGATVEARAQALLQLSQMTGMDENGQPVPLLTAAELKKRYPDASLWPSGKDIQGLRDKRIQAINYGIRDAVRLFRQQNGLPEEAQIPPQWLDLMADQILAQLEASRPQFQLRMDDDPAKHIEGLSEITQDPSADPLEVAVAASRQEMLYQWLAMQQMAQAQQQMAAQGGAPQSGDAAGADVPQGAAPSLPTSRAGGTPNSNAMSPERLRSDVQSLTQAAGTGA